MLSLVLLTAIPAAVALPYLRITSLSLVRGVGLAMLFMAALALDSLTPAESLTILSGLLVVDTLGITLVGLSLVIGLVVLTAAPYTDPNPYQPYQPYQPSVGKVGNQSSVGKGKKVGEYGGDGTMSTLQGIPGTLSLFILVALTGAYYLSTSSDLLTAGLSLELQSFSVYAITAMYRWRSGATRAGLMYFMLGAFSSGLVLLGVSLVYALAGSVAFDTISALGHLIKEGDPSTMGLAMAMVIILAGLLFKITASPFHFWGPSVYDNVPTAVTVIISLVPKFALFGLLLRLSSVWAETPIIGGVVTAMLLVSVALSFAFGSVMGLVQYRIKRLVAYSSVSHIGWMLLSVVIGSTIGLASFGLYLTQYSFTTAITLLALMAVGYSSLLIVPTPMNPGDIETVEALSGLSARSVGLAVVLVLALFSAAGIPPLVGFYAKLSVLQATLYHSQYAVAVLGVISSVVSAGFYLSVISNMVFKPLKKIF